MPNLQRGGGGGDASILHTILCNYTILVTQKGGPWPNGPSPKYAPAHTRLWQDDNYVSLFANAIILTPTFRFTHFQIHNIQNKAIFKLVRVLGYPPTKIQQKHSNLPHLAS